MRLLITGLNGTLAPVVDRTAVAHGWEIIGWNRGEVPPDDVAKSQAWLEQTRPDAIAHLAMGGHDWAAQLAAYAAKVDVPLVFTSTAMVFHHIPDGPHGVNDKRTAEDDYGRSKIRCEDAVLAANPCAAVVRIGWQIDEHASGNNMLATLDQWQQREGCINASRAWRPACSFMTDTADAIMKIIVDRVSGIVHLDSNADEGLTFAQIVAAMKAQFQQDHWIINVNESYVHDQRLRDGAVRMPPLSARLNFA